MPDPESLAWIASNIADFHSRKIVPHGPGCEQPLAFSPPVKAPFMAESWLSSRGSGRAAQFDGHEGLFFRSLAGGSPGRSALSPCRFLRGCKPWNQFSRSGHHFQYGRIFFALGHDVGESYLLSRAPAAFEPPRSAAFSKRFFDLQTDPRFKGLVR